MSRWRAAREELLVKEKAATRARDALNAERRRLPMAEVEEDSIFQGRHRLVVYDFMFASCGLDWLASTAGFRDFTALGRQEAWEVPEGRASALGAPAGSERFRCHDEYED